MAFIDDHRKDYGVEPICKVLPIAPSTYSRQQNPALQAARTRRDEYLCAEIQRVWEANYRVYGVRKVWRRLGREGIAVALHGRALDA